MSASVENETPILINNDSNESELKKSKSGKKLSVTNDPNRFKHGILVRGKFIGVEDVKKENGDETCQTAMIKLKAVVTAKKEHKQRICLKINLDGIEIIDEKTNQLMFKHSVSRISYIARDSTDSRAIGYIYKNSANSFQYFAIKTERQAQELFNNLKDLFEVVLELRNSEKNQKEEKKDETSIDSENKPNDLENETGKQSNAIAEVEVEENKKTSDNLLDLPSDNYDNSLQKQSDINFALEDSTNKPSNELLDVFDEPIKDISSTNNASNENKQVGQNDKFNSLLNELSNLSTSPEQRTPYIPVNQPYFSMSNHNGMQNTNSLSNTNQNQNLNPYQNPFGQYNNFNNQTQMNKAQSTEIPNVFLGNQAKIQNPQTNIATGNPNLNNSNNFFQW